MHDKLKRLLITAILATSVAGAQDEDILRPEQAYRYAVADTGSTIEVDWVVEDGYYLYRNKMSYASSSNTVVFGTIEMPEGERHEDEFFGVQQVYRNRFYVSIPYSVIGDAPDSFELIIKSQGCADIGLCYPPQTWKEPVKLTAAQTGKIDLGSTFGSFAGTDADFLPVDQAFEPVLTAIDGNAIEVAFRVADGYYLYKD